MGEGLAYVKREEYRRNIKFQKVSDMLWSLLRQGVNGVWNVTKLAIWCVKCKWGFLEGSRHVMITCTSMGKRDVKCHQISNMRCKVSVYQ